MPAAPLIDIGVNLTHESYDRDRDAVIERALSAGVTRLIVTGATLAGSAAGVSLAASMPGRLYATAGIHPHHALDCNPASAHDLARLLREPGVVAAGECGLDYFRLIAPAPAQERAFRAQIELAIEAGLPLFLHCRDAHADFLRVLASYGDSLPRAVAHCFTGNRSEVEQCLALGLYVGITGWICDERRGAHLKEVVRAIPAQRLMLETDGPYLLPRDLVPRPRDRRNEPCFLPHIAAVVAAARGETPEELARTSSATAVSFFALKGSVADGRPELKDRITNHS